MKNNDLNILKNEKFINYYPELCGLTNRCVLSSIMLSYLLNRNPNDRITRKDILEDLGFCDTQYRRTIKNLMNSSIVKEIKIENTHERQYILDISALNVYLGCLDSIVKDYNPKSEHIMYNMESKCVWNDKLKKYTLCGKVFSYRCRYYPILCKKFDIDIIGAIVLQNIYYCSNFGEYEYSKSICKPKGYVPTYKPGTAFTEMLSMTDSVVRGRINILRIKGLIKSRRFNNNIFKYNIVKQAFYKPFAKEWDGNNTWDDNIEVYDIYSDVKDEFIAVNENEQRQVKTHFSMHKNKDNKILFKQVYYDALHIDTSLCDDIPVSIQGMTRRINTFLNDTFNKDEVIRYVNKKELIDIIGNFQILAANDKRLSYKLLENLQMIKKKFITKKLNMNWIFRNILPLLNNKYSNINNGNKLYNIVRAAKLPDPIYIY